MDDDDEDLKKTIAAMAEDFEEFMAKHAPEWEHGHPAERRKFDMGYYILDADHNPVPESNVFRWSYWFGTHRAERVVKQEEFPPYYVSTVFLGLDHSMGRMFLDGPPPPGYRPMLFETMVFAMVGSERRLGIQERCSTWNEAIEQHDRIAGEIRKAASS